MLSATVLALVLVSAPIAEATASLPAVANYQGLWWNGSESGWGIYLTHQGETIFAVWFTYDTGGKAVWLAMTAKKTEGDTYSGKLYSTRGPAFNAVPFDSKTVVAAEVGVGRLSFTDSGNGTFHYEIGTVAQTKAIVREVFGKLPTCTYGDRTNDNYEDLWWAGLTHSEPGWGIAMSHQGNSPPASTIVAVWFTYDLGGSPMWLVATAPFDYYYDNGWDAAFASFHGLLYRTSGARFDAFHAADVTATHVGEMQLGWFSPYDGFLNYTVQLSGMSDASKGGKRVTRQIVESPGTACRFNE